MQGLFTIFVIVCWVACLVWYRLKLCRRVVVAPSRVSSPQSTRKHAFLNTEEYREAVKGVNARGGTVEFDYEKLQFSIRYGTIYEGTVSTFVADPDSPKWQEFILHMLNQSKP